MGIIGLIFLYFFPRKHPGKRFNYWIISIKVISIFVSLIAALASFTMCAFAAIHAVALTQMTCSPPDKINTTCLCTTVSSKNSTAESYHYVDLTCTEVNDFFLHYKCGGGTFGNCLFISSLVEQKCLHLFQSADYAEFKQTK
ncbi:hypothetical protein NQ318_007299 [Aromia moschata]|uniref:Uncharacterized protein n=1 Tax=Aromia moschata TaxID=1265417 RepID=A0AAV8YZH4_9CUCU|nr:hypothetical protein NQ318_007299 [Aromia moschata]